MADTDNAAELRSQLEQARRIAVTLEQENAELTSQLTELASRAHEVARTHQLFIEDHPDPGSNALGAQYLLVNTLASSPRHEDLPLNPVETALRLVLAELEQFEYDVTPQQIAEVIADALPRDDMSDRRRRIYLDGKGNAWLSLTKDTVGPLAGAMWSDETQASVASSNGGLREIGRCW
ncbi:hypothetical protein [Streptomyces anulatus]|uniref:hypothetical protein n=1 Tax=Streptomyces anulatus TaxID=1892 RepID=UPI0034167019